MSEKIENNEFSEEESSFDIMEWVSYFLRNWYFFIISIALFLGLAYVANRKWYPIYEVGAKVIIEEPRRAMDASSVLTGFTNVSGFRGLNNQMALMGSTDLIRRTVEKLPLDVEYWTHGKFKSHNLYVNSPIKITALFVAEKAYAIGEFKFSDIDGKRFYLSYTDEKEKENKIEGEYGCQVNNSYFFLVVEKTPYFVENGQFFVRFRRTDDLVNEFHNSLNLAFSMKGSSMLDVKVSGATPERLVDFINKLCDEFLQDNLDRKNEVAFKTIAFIDQQLGLVEDSLDLVETKLGEFRNENNILDVKVYTSELASQMALINKRGEDLTLKKTYIDYLTNYLKGNVADEELVSPASFGITDANLSALIGEYRQAKNKRDNVGTENPFYAKYKEELEQTKLLLFETIDNINKSFDIERKDYERQNRAMQEKINNFTMKESELKNLQRLYTIQDNYYTMLLQKRAEAMIQKSSNSSDNIIMERARICSVVNSSTKSKTYMKYGIMGMLLPIALLVLLKLLKVTVQNKNEIKRMTLYPVLGSIAHVSEEETKEPCFLTQNTDSVFAESFRSLRTQLEFLKKPSAEGGTMILVSSAQPGDGKSYFCINLASIYALFGKKVLLMGCDFRCPSLNEKLNLPKKSKGIVDYLVGNVSLDDILIKGDGKGRNYDLLPSGTIPPNPGDLIHKTELRQLIEEYRKQYDYIVLDTAPVGLISDALALVDAADIKLFVVRYNYTNRRLLRDTMERIKENGMDNVYIVMNDESEKQRHYGYGYGYGGYYGHYYNKKDKSKHIWKRK